MIKSNKIFEENTLLYPYIYIAALSLQILLILLAVSLVDSVAATHHPGHLCCFHQFALMSRLQSWHGCTYLLHAQLLDRVMHGLPVLFPTCSQHTTSASWSLRQSGPLLWWCLVATSRTQSWCPPGILSWVELSWVVLCYPVGKFVWGLNRTQLLHLKNIP